MVVFSLEPGQLLPLSTLPVSLPVLGRYNAASGSLRYGAHCCNSHMGVHLAQELYIC